MKYSVYATIYGGEYRKVWESNNRETAERYAEVAYKFFDEVIVVDNIRDKYIYLRTK